MATAVLLAAILCVYLPALRAGFVWDDDRYVERNLTLRSAEGLRRIWLDVEATPQYHAVNVLLHCCGVSVFVPGAGR